MRIVAQAAILVAFVAFAAPAVAGPREPDHGGAPMDAMQHHMQSPTSTASQRAVGTVPTLPGQDAFGAIQEIIHILEADPKTDWSKVNLEALRQHLIDMNDVTLRAKVVTRPIKMGIEAMVTGRGRTIKAIQRMVPAHAQEVDRRHLNGWNARTTLLPNGVRLTVTTSDPKEVSQLRGLGFIGFLASGANHQRHHLAIAKGEFMDMHAGR